MAYARGYLLAAAFFLLTYAVQGRALRAVTIQTTGTNSEAGCTTATCNDPVKTDTTQAESPNAFDADTSATITGDGAWAKSTLDRTVIGGPPTNPVASTKVISTATNPTGTTGTAYTRAKVTESAGVGVDEASAEGLGKATSSTDGKATVAIDASAKATQSLNQGTATLYAGAAGTTKSATGKNEVYGHVLINANSKGASVNIPLISASGQTLRVVANETTKVGPFSGKTVSTENNITSRSTSTGPGSIVVKDATTAASPTAAESTIKSFTQTAKGEGSGFTFSNQSATYRDSAGVQARAYNKLSLASATESSVSNSFFNASITNMNSRIATSPRLAQAQIQDFRADAQDDDKFAFASDSANATTYAGIDRGTTTAKSVVSFRAHDGPVTTDSYQGLAWRVHGNAYTYDIAKKTAAGKPQAFAIGTVPGGNPRVNEGGINALSGSWISVGRAAMLQNRPYCKKSSCASQYVAFARGQQKNTVKMNGQTYSVSRNDNNEGDDWFKSSETNIVGIQDSPYQYLGKTFGTIDPLTAHYATDFYVNKCDAGECPRALIPPVQLG